MVGTALHRRVVTAAEVALAERGYVSAIDVFLGVGWLAPADLDRWRQGRVECLERVVHASLPKLTKAMAELRRWAARRGLKPSETGYVTHGRARPASAPLQRQRYARHRTGLPDALGVARAGGQACGLPSQGSRATTQPLTAS